MHIQVTIDKKTMDLILVLGLAFVAGKIIKKKLK